MKQIFLTGIPTGGKSYLAKKLADLVGGEVVSTDSLREEIRNDPRYSKWVNFYLNHDEKTYYTTTSPEEQWNNLVAQSEAVWPFMLEKILSYKNHDKPLIFEGVNILPHLAKRDLPFSGLVLVGKSREAVYERLSKENRWGNTPELWNLEADAFFVIERPRYQKEAESCGYKVFETADEAFSTALELLK